MNSNTIGQTIAVGGNTFRLVETIGRGSFGTVHKAINLASGAAVAVKLIGKDKIRRPHDRSSIEKEIETMRVAVEQFENGHPHIVRLLCTKESQHHIYIVLEYCAGGDIAGLMKAQGRLSEDQARSYMTHLASGLKFLRSQKIVHRDLKPANLLLSSRNHVTAKLKIADFGFARQLQSEALAESVVGSPLYMAPELLEYKSYDAKADLWSVGIILYEMLVNDHPFLLVNNCQATNHFALRKNIYRYFELFGHIRLPKDVTVSKDCSDLLEGLLRVNPQQRISFEDFFNAEFLKPRPNALASAQEASGMDGSSSSLAKQALVHETSPEYEEWASMSEEYVIVEREFEDVGRKVLNEKDLKVAHTETPVSKASSSSSSTSSSPLKEETVTSQKSPAADLISPPDLSKSETTESPPPVHVEPSSSSPRVASLPPTDMLVESPTSKAPLFRPHVVPCEPTPAVPPPAPQVHEPLSPPPLPSSRKPQYSVPATTLPRNPMKDNELANGPRQWAYNDENVEELLGICYKSFSLGSVALFVPTPLGDYIAFHEGCPHYYLSMESIEAAKQEGRLPPYVLGCIVLIEDSRASSENNPYQLREGTEFHIVTVTALSSETNASSSSASSETTLSTDSLPLSENFAAHAVLSPPPPAAPTEQKSSFFSISNPFAAITTPAPQPPPQPPTSFAYPPASAFASTGVVSHHQRISFRNFQISSLALFFLKAGKLPYVAFNQGAPNYYLSNESIAAARGNDKALPAYICGEIIFIDSFQATEDFNPYRLPYGTRFHVVTVANPQRT